MGSEVRIDLVAKGAAPTARDIDKVGDAAEKAGDDLKGMADKASALDKAIASNTETLAKLRVELAKAPDDKALRKEVRGQERETNYLKRLKKNIEEDGRRAGEGFFSGLTEALGTLAAQAKGAGAPIGIALAAGIAPFLGATVAAAVLGSVGAGGIAGGIAAAAQDPRVKAAGTHLGESLGSSFEGIGGPFIEPLIEQMGRLEGIGSSFFTDLGADIAPLADHLDNLVDGVAGFAENFDLGNAAQAAGPILDVIGKKLPDAADALTNALDSISEGGAGAEVALEQTFEAIEGGIQITGRLVGELAKIEPYVTTGGGALLDLLDTLNEKDLPLGLAGWIAMLDQSGEAALKARGPTKDFGDGVAGVGDAAETSSEKIEGLSDAFDKLFGKQMSLDEANAAYKQGMRDLNEQLTDGKRTLNENTQAGLDNAGAVRDQIGVIEDLRQAQFAQTGNLQEANATYDEHIAQLKATLKNLGYNKKEVEELVGAYQRLPKDGVDVTFRSPGLWAALQRMRELARLLGSAAAGRNAAEGSEPVSGRAVGGPVMAGKPYLVGEKGPELVTFGANGTVHTAEQTAAMLSGSSGGSAGSTGGMTEAQLVRLIAATSTAAAAAVVNRAQVVMDGRAIGQLQADEADIYYRSG